MRPLPPLPGACNEGAGVLVDLTGVTPGVITGVKSKGTSLLSLLEYLETIGIGEEKVKAPFETDIAPGGNKGVIASTCEKKDEGYKA